MERRPLVIALLAPSGMAPLSGSVIVHVTGTTTYPETIKPSSTITVSGGDATFLGTVQSGTIVAVSGGVATFLGSIQATTTFNLSGGLTTIDTLQNNADINVTGSAVLKLTQAVGNNGTVSLQDTGTLILDADDIFANNSQLIASGGSIETQGNDFSFDSVELTGSTIIDLGDSAGSVDLGGISGTGEIVFTNWTTETVINLDPSSTITAGSQLIFDGAETVFDGSTVSPVPEPAQTALAILIVTGCFVLNRRRREHS